MTKGEKTFNLLNIFFMLLFTVIIILPFWSVMINSVREASMIARRGFVFLPEDITIENYKFFFVNSSRLLWGYRSTIIITVMGTFLNLLFTSMMAYPLSKKYLPGRTGIIVIVLITMFFSGGLIPYYVLVIKLGLKDSWFALILPGLISAWNMLLMRNFYSQVPDSLEESALIEGASDAQVLFRVVIPLSLPAMATIGLFYAVDHWNSWFSALLFIDTVEKRPLQMQLRTIIFNLVSIRDLAGGRADVRPSVSEHGLRASAIILSILPILFVYPFIQKYFVKGLFIGSLKG